MSYEALARRWRPKVFHEVIGQDHVVNPLKNAVLSGRIHHAYLFAGTRGVGKTTVARILARAINCSSGELPDPCNSCDICNEILHGISTDILEIDGASNTGIDDVRRLRETAVYVPSKGRYRVYIIDEVHMLSRQAFNGLLKILEEPPPHLVFIFATTEPFRIPETVLSRMIRFDFRLIPEGRVKEHLVHVCERESIACDDPSASYISYISAGSIRDSLSLLEQCALAGEGVLKYEKVLAILGYPEAAGVSRLAEATVDGNAQDAIQALRNLYGGGTDLKNLYSAFLGLFRLVALHRFVEAPSILDGETEQVKRAVGEISGKLSREECLFLFDVILKSERDILMSEFPLHGFEAMLLRAISFRELLDVAGTMEAGRAPGEGQDISHDRGKPFSGVEVTSSSSPGGKVGEQSTPPMVAELKSSGPADGNTSPPGEDKWEAFLTNVSARKKFVLKGLLENMRGGFDGEQFVIRCEFDALLEKLREPDKWNIIEDAVRETLGVPVGITLQKEDPGSSTGKEPSDERGDLERKALSDPVVIELLREFPGSRIGDIKKIDPGKKKGTGGFKDPNVEFGGVPGSIPGDFIEEEEE